MTICELHKGLQILRPVLLEGKRGIRAFSSVVKNAKVWTLQMLFFQSLINWKNGLLKERKHHAASQQAVLLTSVDRIRISDGGQLTSQLGCHKPSTLAQVQRVYATNWGWDTTRAQWTSVTHGTGRPVCQAKAWVVLPGSPAGLTPRWDPSITASTCWVSREKQYSSSLFPLWPTSWEHLNQKDSETHT